MLRPYPALLAGNANRISADERRDGVVAPNANEGLRGCRADRHPSHLHTCVYLLVTQNAEANPSQDHVQIPIILGAVGQGEVE